MNTRPLPSDFLPLTASRRLRIERTIETLIAMLDLADGDETLEPCLGWTTKLNQAGCENWTGAAPWGRYDGELDIDEQAAR